ncbi:MAG: hypothetical protein M3463_04370 [Verrucomicrobiota bacterium]|nr:hypothetical protein [Verrucomicrobiota bacterium]
MATATGGEVGGYVVRLVEEAGVDAAGRVAVHRAAWLPSALSWHPDHRPPIAVGAESSFSAEV